MINIQKLEAPVWLCQNREVKTAEYKEAPSGSKPSPWRASEIVNTLKMECAKKCMYCECFIDDTSYSAVEHIRPKKDFEDLVLEWSNLGLACGRCNTNKGEYWTDSPAHQLLNPYQDIVENHIEFVGPLTTAKLGSTRGANTVRKLKLMREDLMLSRIKRIEEVDARLRVWHEEQDDELKELFAEDLAAAVAPDREFSGLLRAYVIRAGFPVGKYEVDLAGKH